MADALRPDRHGFDHYFTLLGGGADYYTHAELNEGAGQVHLYENGRKVNPQGYMTDIFTERAVYERVKQARVLTRETVAKLYGIAPGRISDFVEFDAANAIKFTIFRERPSGSPGDPDIFGSQQYAPLLEIEVPDA